MLYTTFVLIISMSITASIVIAVVLAARLLLKKMPKIFSYLLWGIVLFRLICPFSFSTPFSIVGDMRMEIVSALQDAGREISSDEWKEQVYEQYVQKIEKQQEEEYYQQTGQGYENIKEKTEPAVETFLLDESSSYEKQVNITLPAKLVSLAWLSGMVIFLAGGLVSHFLLKKKLTGTLHIKNNIYECDYITTPFVLGIIKPKIYLPSTLAEEEKEYIILHEQIHIRRGDHIFRLLAYLALAMHWFNPLVWVAFYMSGVDMEMSCDETVMRKTGKDIRKEYASSLLAMAAGKKIFNGTLLAFGEDNTKGRIKNIMNYKKHATFLIVIAAVIVIILAVILGSNPKEENADLQQDSSQESELLSIDTTIEAETAQPESEIVQETLSADELMQQEYRTDQVYKWADAFCARDGETIVALCSPELADVLEENGFLDKGEDWVSFGFSSPWPLTYDIREVTESTAVIAYYAWTSDPHYTVWIEEIQFQAEEGFQVTGSELTYYDDIKTSEEFRTAYKDGIEWTPLAYIWRDTGEALNQNALEKQSPGYEQLFDPETAAIYLLNLNPEAVTIDVTSQEGYGRATLVLMFEDFGTTGSLITIQMIQPYGTDGIWVPRDNPAEKEERWDYYKEYQEMLGENFLMEFYEFKKLETIDVSADDYKVVEVYTGNIGDGDSGFVLIKDAKGELLYNEFAHIARAGWNNIYMSDLAEDNFIMTLHIEDRDTYGSYRYQVYRVIGKDKIQVLAENSFSFEQQSYNREEFRRFMEPLSRYLAASHLLLSTQEGEVRIDNVSEADKYSFENLVKGWE